MNKDSLKGTGKIYAFTLKQLLKSKSNRVTFIILALLAILAVPVMCAILNNDAPPPISQITKVYINNETNYDVSKDNLDAYFSLISFEDVDISAEEAAGQLSPSELFARVHNDSADGSVALTLLKTSETTVTDAEIELFRSALCENISRARYEFIGIPPAQIKTAMSDYDFNVMTAAEYNSNEASFAASYTIQYAYAIILLIVSMFSIVFIIRTVIEEKASKLVELLMVSVKPLALLAGKILAVMTYIFGMLIVVVLLFLLSLTISGNIFDLTPITSTIAELGINPDILNIGPAAFISVFVSLILAYMTFSIIAGLSGTSCSVMDDVERANMTVTFTLLGAYILSVFVSSVGSGPLAIVGSLVPIVSAFVAPVQYILGGIGIGLLAVSWVIQIAVIVLLAMFSSRVYRSLIMYNGSRVKLKLLLTMYRQHSETEA